jgi:hypothetical protein
MGRMKDVYMEVMEEYGNVLPNGFSLAEYMMKKQLEDAEQQEMFEKLEREKASEDSPEDVSGDKGTDEVRDI